MEVSASIFCARESWRGSASIASTVTLRAGKRLHQFRVLRRPDEGNQRLARLHQRHFIRGRGAYLEDYVRLRPEIGGRRRDCGPCRDEHIVVEIRPVASPLLDDDGESELDQLRHHLRRDRDALLAGKYFLWDTNSLRHSVDSPILPAAHRYAGIGALRTAVTPRAKAGISTEPNSRGPQQWYYAPEYLRRPEGARSSLDDRGPEIVDAGQSRPGKDGIAEGARPTSAAPFCPSSTAPTCGVSGTVTKKIAQAEIWPNRRSRDVPRQLAPSDRFGWMVPRGGPIS